MPPLLLVTGSRSLVSLPGAEAWAKGEVARALDELGPEAVVLHGGAEGPDTWGGEVARSRGLRVIVYRPSGWRLDTRRPTRRWSEVSVHPLVRNEAEVAAAVRVRAAGDRVLVLALFAPGTMAGTQGGTSQTRRLAREAGLEVWEREWASRTTG